MAANLTLHLKNFNDKVRIMNQTNSRDLTLSAAEARNLQADIMDLLNYCTTIIRTQAQESRATVENNTDLRVDGGKF